MISRYKLIAISLIATYIIAVNSVHRLFDYVINWFCHMYIYLKVTIDKLLNISRNLIPEKELYK